MHWPSRFLVGILTTGLAQFIGKQYIGNASSRLLPVVAVEGGVG